MSDQCAGDESVSKEPASLPSLSPFEKQSDENIIIDDYLRSGGARIPKMTFDVESQQRQAPRKLSKTVSKLSRASKRATTVQPTGDIVWQENPSRILNYRANHLHYYGWIPLILWRNVKATVFSDLYIHVQTLVLVSWVMVLHFTGLGVPDADLKTFIKLFGTPHAGSILNLGMVMVFILGLFISSVINRWSAIRQAYGQLRGTTLDLCMILVNTIHSQSKEEEKKTMQARTELIRLLNLGHLLLVSRADKETTIFRKNWGLKTISKSISKHALRRSHKLLADMGFGQSIVREVEDRWEHIWRKNPRDVTYSDLLDEGLVNPDEWTLLLESEQEGLPSYQAVYYWVQALVHKCRAADWVVSAPQMLPMILTKANFLSSCGSTILSSISSQMPYPYVHLVSFVAHAYLLVLSTWFGCFLRVGYPSGETFSFNGDDSSFDIKKPGRKITENPWTIFWIYMLTCVANIMFQGLLNMHTLLDNPFGSHCSKFPLRAQVSQVMSATRAMLGCADSLPKAFGDVFSLEPLEPQDDTEDSLHPRGSLFANFLYPPSRKGSIQGSALRSGSSLRTYQSVTFSKDIGTPGTPEPRKSARVGAMDIVDEGRKPAHMDNLSPRTEADESMVRKSEPSSAPRTTKCVSRGLSIHNQVVFGNLPERQTSLGTNISGDATLQELFLQVSVADAMQHSFSALRSSLERSTDFNEDITIHPQAPHSTSLETTSNPRTA